MIAVGLKALDNRAPRGAVCPGAMDQNDISKSVHGDSPRLWMNRNGAGESGTDRMTVTSAFALQGFLVAYGVVWLPSVACARGGNDHRGDRIRVRHHQSVRSSGDLDDAVARSPLGHRQC